MIHAFRIARPLLHRLPPEAVHKAGLWALAHGLVPAVRAERFPSLETRAFGLTFSNPIGLAAGFDKNAVAIDALLAQGFGFIEAGTVTPLPQPGNPQPRLFRLIEDEAVINRMGFNNDGLETFARNFRRRRGGIAGANIGKNKDSADAIADYVTGLCAVYPHADYITVNVSSPNTPGLRSLQHGQALMELLTALKATRAECARTASRTVPLLLKVAPDLTPPEREAIAEAAMAQGMDGLIVSNTTISRPESLKSPRAREQGGLSGRPLFSLSTDTLKDFHRLTGGKLPLIGVGGIFTAEDAYAKIRAGATLVQLYTALVYHGFGVARDVQRGLAALLEKDGIASVQQAVGTDAR